MKLMLQLNVLFACFLSAEQYVTVYACSTIITDCNAAGPEFLAKKECQANGSTEEACGEEAKKDKGNFIKKYGNYRCEQCQFGKVNEDNGNAKFPPYQPKTPPPNPAIASTASLPNPENTSVSVPPKPQNGIDIVFSDMDIPLGVPPSAGSGRSTEPGIGPHFVIVFVAVAFVGTAICHGILL
ncbi:hypothetical protein niasHT_010855 [Heterodera trifolii]|uniref:Uncharacterized protein n=1 Tax=Heterodera trifolii TaxID=157864 RepID=A0ABD2LCY4_9BILA